MELKEMAKEPNFNNLEIVVKEIQFVLTSSSTHTYITNLALSIYWFVPLLLLVIIPVGIY